MKKTTEPLEIHRGDVLWVQCDPSIGHEPRKIRTCVVVSNEVANQFGGAITVVPTQRYTAERAARRYCVDLGASRSTLEERRVANASMVTTYDRSRFLRRAGRLHGDTIRLLDRALSVHLALESASES